MMILLFLYYSFLKSKEMTLRNNPIYMPCALSSPLFINTLASILHVLRTRHPAIIVVDSPCTDILIDDLETSINALYDNKEDIHFHPIRFNVTRFSQTENRDDFYNLLVEGQTTFLMLMPVAYHKHVFKMAHSFNLLGPYRQWIIPNFNTSLYDNEDGVPKQILTFELNHDMNHGMIDVKDVAVEMIKVHHLHK